MASDANADAFQVRRKPLVIEAALLGGKLGRFAIQVHGRGVIEALFEGIFLGLFFSCPLKSLLGFVFLDYQVRHYSFKEADYGSRVSNEDGEHALASGDCGSTLVHAAFDVVGCKKCPYLVQDSVLFQGLDHGELQRRAFSLHSDASFAVKEPCYV